MQIDQKYVWVEEQERRDFRSWKAQLSLTPILRQPIRGRPFQLHTNWSILGLGTMFTQLDDDGQEFVVAYANRSNNKIEVKYYSYEGECITLLFVQFFF